MDTWQTLAQNVQMLASLPSVIAQTLDKETILVPECIDFCHVSLFAEFNFHGTRQIALLSSVTLGKAALFAEC